LALFAWNKIYCRFAANMWLDSTFVLGKEPYGLSRQFQMTPNQLIVRQTCEARETLFYRSVMAAALTFALLLPVNMIAGTITFSDLTETPSIIDGTGGRVSGSCVGESCTVTLTAPFGYTLSSFDVNGGVWMEPGANSISDLFCVPNVCTTTPGSVFVAFTSDGETSLPDQIGCLTHPGLCPAEDGTVQLAGEVFWKNGPSQIIDSFQFQSDVDSVPEPRSGLLWLTGVALLSWLRRTAGRNV
jgi:hypothetical protein